MRVVITTSICLFFNLPALHPLRVRRLLARFDGSALLSSDSSSPGTIKHPILSRSVLLYVIIPLVIVTVTRDRAAVMLQHRQLRCNSLHYRYTQQIIH